MNALFFANANTATTEAPSPITPNTKPIISTKTYGHDMGLSVAFRQWRAQSHCRFIHGYALGVKFVFSAMELDSCGWVVDFGGLKDMKEMLVDSFDHKLVVAYDDPQRANFELMHMQGLADVVIFPATGCEAFSRMIYDAAEQWLKDAGFSARVTLVSVEVSEHGGNSAICQG